MVSHYIHYSLQDSAHPSSDKPTQVGGSMYDSESPSSTLSNEEDTTLGQHRSEFMSVDPKMRRRAMRPAREGEGNPNTLGELS